MRDASDDSWYPKCSRRSRKTATDLGLAVTETALTGLPTTMAEYVVPLPSQASATLFQHAVIETRTHRTTRGYQPTSYTVAYDAGTKEYRVALSGLFSR